MLVRTGMYHFEVSRTALYRVRYVLARTSTYHLLMPCTRCTGFQMLWLASCRDDDDAAMADRGPLTWEPARLSTDSVEFDSSCLGAEVEVHNRWTVTYQDNTTHIKGEGDLKGTITQCRYRLLEAECLSPVEYLRVCESILENQSSISVRASSKWLPMRRNTKTSCRSDHASSGTVFEWRWMQIVYQHLFH
jgi:hypothetical protein